MLFHFNVFIIIAIEGKPTSSMWLVLCASVCVSTCVFGLILSAGHNAAVCTALINYYRSHLIQLIMNINRTQHTRQQQQYASTLHLLAYTKLCALCGHSERCWYFGVILQVSLSRVKHKAMLHVCICFCRTTLASLDKASLPHLYAPKFRETSQFKMALSEAKVKPALLSPALAITENTEHLCCVCHSTCTRLGSLLAN